MVYYIRILISLSLLACCVGTLAQTAASPVPGLATPAADLVEAAHAAAETDSSQTQTGSSNTQACPAERPVDCSKSGRARAPIIRLPVAETPPVIDGDLSDPCWQRAYHDDGFWDTDRNCAPKQTSEVFACVDNTHIYVAAYCHDTHPARIRAQETKRNGNIWRDDFIEVEIDPAYSPGASRYEFSVTPRGTMEEDIPGGSDAKVEWRGDWQAAGCIIDDGWLAEVAIPWQILRYPEGQTEIGLAVRRRVARTERSSTWPNMGAGWDSREMARIVGLNMPCIKRPTIWMPNIQTEWTEDRFRTNIGLDVKRTFQNGLTALGTWAPDFRNIEQEVESIDFSYTERRYDDRRPFFVTGEGFLPGGSMFYSRRIEDLDLGLKLFGRAGETDVGALQTFTFGDRNDTAIRVDHDIDDLWDVDAQYVRRDVDGDPLNQAWEIGFDRYEPKGAGGFWMGAEYAESATAGAPGGNRWEVAANRWGGQGEMSYGLHYNAVSPDFDPQNGYQPEVDRRGWTVDISYYDRPDGGPLHSYDAGMYYNDYEHYDGSVYHRDYGLWTSLERSEHRDGIHFDTGWSDRPPHDDHTTGVSYFWGADELHTGGRIGYSWGKRGSGDYQRYRGEWAWQFAESFYGSLAYERRISDFWDPAEEDVDVDRLTLRLNRDFDEEHGCGLCMRTGTQGTNIFVTYRQSVRVGTDLFVIFGDPNTDETQTRLAVKTKWVWK